MISPTAPGSIGTDGPLGQLQRSICSMLSERWLSGPRIAHPTEHTYCAYCLMTNRVHLIAVPGNEGALGLAVGEAHRRDTRHVNFREGWRRQLWQGRFASFPMDERHLPAAAGFMWR